MLKEKIEQLRNDHPYIAWVVEKAAGVAKAGSDKMSGTVGRTTHGLKYGLGKAHDQIRRWRGGDPDAEQSE